LITAAKSDDAKIVRYLIEHGADINIADEHGWTPYIHAVACESWDAAHASRKAGSAIPAIGELIALVPSKLLKADDDSAVAITEDGLTIKTGKSDNLLLNVAILVS
jgi:ankyrin repeat protein